MTANPRLIAFYLPQYHPIPENDAWWGRGFTEWTNVVKARPCFAGHYQPHLPADLGFYDLRLAETREAQAALAREFGIHGFCYYHYWFNGRRVLERPFDEVLTSGKPAFPFCICWANENWTRTWDGQEHDILLEQRYSRDDDLAHIESLLPALKDPRYIRVDDRPLLLIYRITRLPEPNATIERWRNAAVKAGLPGLFVCNVENYISERGVANALDLDAAVEFAPDWLEMPPPIGRGPMNAIKQLVLHGEPGARGYVQHYVGSYGEVAANMMAKPEPPYLRFPGVTPMWDNTPRHSRGGVVLHGSTPALYEDWLKHALMRARSRVPDQQLVFINAWNEWSEGSHLEPCQLWGRGYLEVTRNALAASRSSSTLQRT